MVWYSPAFASMATWTAQIKRPPAISGGKRGTWVLDSTKYNITPLDSFDAETRFNEELGSPYELKYTFMEHEDILDLREGYILVVNNRDYNIKSVAEYPYDEVYFYYIIVEELRP